MKPSPRLRRVLRIARDTALMHNNAVLYWSDVNAWRRHEATLPPLRTQDDDDCPF